mmetsp:Transcript_112300/g.250651  ORF Transcript_112300/g.250651 Transcript_112300/m.250651 type:complete len:236 (-) Transcript_112300:336-1043(-)
MLHPQIAEVSPQLHKLRAIFNNLHLQGCEVCLSLCPSLVELTTEFMQGRLSLRRAWWHHCAERLASHSDLLPELRDPLLPLSALLLDALVQGPNLVHAGLEAALQAAEPVLRPALRGLKLPKRRSVRFLLRSATPALHSAHERGQHRLRSIEVAPQTAHLALQVSLHHEIFSKLLCSGGATLSLHLGLLQQATRQLPLQPARHLLNPAVGGLLDMPDGSEGAVLQTPHLTHTSSL